MALPLYPHQPRQQDENQRVQQRFIPSLQGLETMRQQVTNAIDPNPFGGLPAAGGLPKPAAQPAAQAAQPAKPKITAEQFNAIYGPPPAKPVAPAPEQPKDDGMEWADYGRALMAGGTGIVQGLGTLTGNKTLEQAGQRAGEYWRENLSEAAKRAQQTEILGDGTLGDKWNKVKLMAAESGLGTIAGMGAGGLATKGLQAAGVGKAASGVLGFGAGEGAIAGATSAGQGAQQVRELSQETLDSSPEYQAILARNGGDKDAAREELAGKVAKQSALTAGGATALLGAPMGAVFGRWVGGEAGQQAAKAGLGKLMQRAEKTLPGRVAVGGLGEAGQEAMQSGAEQIAGNVAMQRADQQQGTFDNVLESMAAGALTGGVMGGAMGTLSQRPAPETNQDETQPEAQPPQPEGQPPQNPPGNGFEDIPDFPPTGEPMPAQPPSYDDYLRSQQQAQGSKPPAGPLERAAQSAGLPTRENGLDVLRAGQLQTNSQADIRAQGLPPLQARPIERPAGLLGQDAIEGELDMRALPAPETPRVELRALPKPAGEPRKVDVNTLSRLTRSALEIAGQRKPIQVIQSADQSPVPVPEGQRAIEHEGRLLLIADRHTSGRDVQRTAAEETLRATPLADIFGPDFLNQVRQLAGRTQGGSRALARIEQAQAQGQPVEQAQADREVIAGLLEDKAAAREVQNRAEMWLRQQGFRGGFSPAEVRRIVGTALSQRQTVNSQLGEDNALLANSAVSRPDSGNAGRGEYADSQLDNIGQGRSGAQQEIATQPENETTVPAGDMARLAGKEQAVGNAGALTGPVQQQQEAEKNSPTPPKMSEEDYLNANGAPFMGGAEPALHRTPGGFSNRGPGSREARVSKVMSDMQANNEKRDVLRKEYAKLVADGKIIQPSLKDELLRTAGGDQDKESVMAARRLLKRKFGIDYENVVGSPGNLSEIPNSSLQAAGNSTAQQRDWRRILLSDIDRSVFQDHVSSTIQNDGQAVINAVESGNIADLEKIRDKYIVDSHRAQGGGGAGPGKVKGPRAGAVAVFNAANSAIERLSNTSEIPNSSLQSPAPIQSQPAVEIGNSQNEIGIPKSPAPIQAQAQPGAYRRAPGGTLVRADRVSPVTIPQAREERFTIHELTGEERTAYQQQAGRPVSHVVVHSRTGEVVGAGFGKAGAVKAATDTIRAMPAQMGQSFGEYAASLPEISQAEVQGAVSVPQQQAAPKARTQIQGAARTGADMAARLQALQKAQQATAQPQQKAQPSQAETVPAMPMQDAGTAADESPATPAQPEATPAGNPRTIKTSNGMEVKVRGVIVPRSQVVSSTRPDGTPNKEYPPQYQPRKREKIASVQQMQKIGRTLDPDVLGHSKNPTGGSPVAIRGEDGRLYVLSGNGRAGGIEHAYNTGNAAEYRQWVEENAELAGRAQDEVAGMPDPVFVRVIDGQLSEAEIKRFAMEANQTETLAQSPAEIARADADRLSDGDMALYAPDESGNVLASGNMPFLRQFAKLLGADIAAYLDDNGNYTKQLADRAQAAVFHKAYKTDRLTALLAESADVDIRNILNGLNQAAPAFAKARALNETLGNFDVVTPLVAAVDFIQSAKRSGTRVDEALAQQDAFNKLEPEVEVLASFIDQTKRSGKRMGEAFKQMAKFVESELSPNKSMFGLETSREEIILEGIKRTREQENENRTTGLFGDAGTGNQRGQQVESQRASASVQATARPDGRTGSENPAAESRAPTDISGHQRLISAIQDGDATPAQISDGKAALAQSQEILLEELRGMTAAQLRDMLPPKLAATRKNFNAKQLAREVYGFFEKSYAEAEAAKPKPAKFSQSKTQAQQQPGSYASAAALSSALRAEFGNTVADWVERNAVITDSAGLARILGEDAAGAKGAVHNGKLYLVHDQLNPANLRGTVLHESVHLALNQHIGDQAFQRLLREVAQMNRMRQPQARAAYDAVPEGTQEEHIAEEALAYLVEAAPQTSLARRVISQVKEWLLRMGLSPRALGLTDGDIAAMAARALQATARQQASSQMDGPMPATETGGAMFSKGNPPTPAQRRSIKDAIKSSLSTLRPVVLGAFGRQQLTDMYKGMFTATPDTLAQEKVLITEAGGKPRYFNQGKDPVVNYNNLVQMMDGDANNMGQEAWEHAEAWAKLDKIRKGLADDVAHLMNDATFFEVHPDNARPFIPGMNIPDVENEIAEQVKAAQRLRNQGNLSDELKANLKNMEAQTAKLRKQLEHEKARRQASIRLRNEWAKLPTEAREVYKNVRHQYSGQMSLMEEALIQRIARSEQMDANSKKALQDKIRLEFEKAAKGGPYFPLQRFGDFTAYYTKDGAESEFHTFESDGQRAAYTKQMKAEGWAATEGVKLEEVQGGGGANAGLVMDIFKVLDEANAGLELGATERAAMDQANRAVKDSIYQLFLTTLPELSNRKHFIHRKRTPGYSTDALKAYGKNMAHGAKQIARTRYVDQMESQLRAMREAYEATRKHEGEYVKDLTAGGHLYNEMIKRHEQVLNPPGAEWVNKTSAVAFIWYLGITPAAAALNITQTPLVAYPVIAAKFGYGKTGKAMLKASRQYMKTFKSGEWKKGFMDISRTPGLTEDEKAYLEQMQAEGVIDVTQAHDLAGMGGEDPLAVNDKLRKANMAVGYLFHYAEVFNRQVTGLAAYRLARESGMAHDAAAAEARKLIYEGHFDYSANNRPRIMRGNVAKVLTMYKQYSQNVIYTFSRALQQMLKGETPEVRAEARKKFAGLMLMQAGVAGVIGLPAVTTILWAAEALINAGLDDDEEIDLENELRNYLADSIGQEAAETLLKGLPRGARHLPGIGGAFAGDIHGRLNMSSLLFRESDKDLEGHDFFSYYLEQALGPAVGMAASWTDGIRMVAGGEWARGMEKLTPKFLRDHIRTLRYQREGVLNMQGEPIVEDLQTADKIAQMLGFAPARVAEVYEARGAVKNKESQIMKARQRLMNRYWQAHKEGDDDGKAIILERIREYNQRNPEMRIDRDTIARSIRQHRKVSARTEMGIVVNQKLERRLRQEARFAE